MTARQDAFPGHAPSIPTAERRWRHASDGRRVAGIVGPRRDRLRRAFAASHEHLEARHAGAALAALHVMEGATLGGAVLARRVLRLGLTRGRGAASLDPYGPDRGAMWRGFLAALGGAALTPEEEADLGAQAAAVFALFAARVPAGAPVAPLRPRPVPV